ncbi:MAG TPA: hypothetical protein VK645_11425 [Chitinophagaceae bacterium]|nr:hypothetical protein [Chitinophagaceae bacterium]
MQSIYLTIIVVKVKSFKARSWRAGNARISVTQLKVRFSAH